MAALDPRHVVRVPAAPVASSNHVAFPCHCRAAVTLPGVSASPFPMEVANDHRRASSNYPLSKERARIQPLRVPPFLLNPLRIQCP